MDEITANLQVRQAPTSSYLSISPQRDRNHNPIVILHGACLPSTVNAADIANILSPVTTNFVLVYTNAGVSSTTLAGVRAFRAAYESLPLQLRQRVLKIVALHVSFLLRTQVYAASIWMQCGEYSKLVYCDLLVDLEKELGVDFLLLGITSIDIEYDEKMRFWVGRQHEHLDVASPDPKNALLNLDDVSVSADNLDAAADAAQRAASIEP